MHAKLRLFVQARQRREAKRDIAGGALNRSAFSIASDGARGRIFLQNIPQKIAFLA